MKFISKVIFLFILYVITAKKAYAYLDPGSGSFMFQLLMGAILGGLFTIKIYFKKIKSFFIKLFNKQKKDKNGQNSKH